MSLLWPGFLFLMGIIPLLIGVYLMILSRRRRYALRYSSLSLVRQALQGQPWWRRHLPFILFLLALSSLLVAMSRPMATVKVPTGQVTVILTIDVSRSMCMTDIPPNRLKAAEEAAKSFIRRQDPGVQIGVVAFAGLAALIQEPTEDLDALESAVEGLTTGRRTAIGSGIEAALNAIVEVKSGQNSGDPNAQPTPVPPGEYAPDIIVLLTDGVSNSGPLPVDAAQKAVERGIRVYTIGFGTDNENQEIPNCNQVYWGGDPFDNSRGFGGGGGAGGFRRGIDEETLRQVAAMTGGEYYYATSADELQTVFDNLPSYLTTREEFMEVSVAFAALGAILAALAVGLSILWNPAP